MTRRYAYYLTLALLCGVLFAGCSCSGEESNTQETTQSGQVEEDRLLSIEEAESLMRGQGGGSHGDCFNSFKPYMENNLLYNNPEAPCNEGEEALKDFIPRFERDAKFQKARTRRNDPSLAIPEIKEGDFEIREPDESRFFASWHVIEADYASFCTGWLNSEMEQEYIFERLDDGCWYLVGYIGPM